MGRTKLFNREDVLSKAMPLFWTKGYSETGLKELEDATGVNKSGLYAEFQSKDDLFIESLRYYYDTRKEREILSREPAGFTNIEDYFRAIAARSRTENIGCFGINCMRDLDHIPSDARKLIEGSRSRLYTLFLKNLEVETTKLPSPLVAEFLCTFFSGFCIEHNLKNPAKTISARIDGLMTILRAM